MGEVIPYDFPRVERELSQKLNKKSREIAESITQVVEDMKAYMPLTLRALYYQLVGRHGLENSNASYNRVGRIVKWMRLNGELSWDAVEDRTRTVTAKVGYSSVQEYGNMLVNGLRSYDRCTMQGQQNYIEVWIEKDALLPIVQSVSDEHCIRTVSCRGFDSLTLLKGFSDRAWRAIQQEQRPVMLYMGDFDPSGVEMLYSKIQSLGEYFGLPPGVVTYERLALNEDQIDLYELPATPNTAKLGDTRSSKFSARFGDRAYELDALHPADLQDLVREGIRSYLDMEEFATQREIESLEREQIPAIQEKMRAALAN